MSTTILEAQSLPAPPWSHSTVWRGWINVILAAVAMTATLPGRTFGLGLIEKQLIADDALGIDAEKFAFLNGWAVVIGAALCLPTGKLIDRFGVRVVLIAVSVGLGLAVLGMSAATNAVMLLLTLTLVRGLGQGALSVVSLAMIGKWFTRRLPAAMGVFSVLTAFGFAFANFAVATPVPVYGWRAVWAALGIFLLVVLAPVGGLLVSSKPETLDAGSAGPLPRDSATRHDFSLAAALASPAFWVFTVAASLFNLAFSAITLFNESILEERGFGRDDLPLVMAVLFLAGLPANLICGFLANRWPLGRLLAGGMLLLAATLAAYPHITNLLELALYGAGLGVSGGIITVVFFAFYGQAFGRRHLGAIQAVAQVMTVLASALGPVLLQWSKSETDSYMPFFNYLVPVAVVVGILVWVVRMPSSTTK